MVEWLIILISCLGIGLPTLFALAASWYDIASRQIRYINRAPRQRSVLTVVLYHTSIIGTRLSIAALRRLTSLRPEIIIIIPAEHSSQIALLRRSIRLDTRTRLHIKQHAASRTVAIASCYPLLTPTRSVLVIDSGDIVSAATIHSAQRLLRDRPSLTAILLERTRQIEPTIPSILGVFGVLAKHVLYAFRAVFRLPLVSALPAGTLLRTGYQLRTHRSEQSCYSRIAPIYQKDVPQFAYLRPRGSVLGILILFIIGYSYYLAASLQTIQPLLLVWIVSAWLATVSLSTYRPRHITDAFLLVSIIPLMGIVAPVTLLIIVTSTAIHTTRLLLRQGLTWTGREHAAHRIFFGTRHP